MKIIDTSTIIGVLKEADYPKIFQICANKKYQLIIPSTVFVELKNNKKTFKEYEKFKNIFKIERVDKSLFQQLSSRYPYLHSGEIGVICTGLKLKQDGKRFICILDDRKASNLSKNIKLRTSGLIGLIKWQKESGFLDKSECRLIHKNLYSSMSFYITKNVLDELIR